MASSVVRGFDYDPAVRRLEIRFVTGRRYAYRGVPAEVVEALRAAPSQGAYFNMAIRDAYPSERLRSRLNRADISS